MPAALLWLGLGTADRLLLPNSAPAEAGLYATAVKLALLVGLVSTAFELGWSPRALMRRYLALAWTPGLRAMALRSS